MERVTAPEQRGAPTTIEPALEAYRASHLLTGLLAQIPVHVTQMRGYGTIVFDDDLALWIASRHYLQRPNKNICQVVL